MPQRRDPKTNPKAFLGKRLRVGRISAGFSSQEALAAKLGFDRSVVAKAETGDRPPTSDVLTAWCEACGLDADLFTDLAELARSGDGPVPTWFEDYISQVVSRKPYNARTEAIQALHSNYSKIVTLTVRGLFSTRMGFMSVFLDGRS